MKELNWFEFIPSTMSAIAAIAAAFAAFRSLRVSRESKWITEQSALALYHGGAAAVLSDALELLKVSTRDFAEFAQDLWIDWSKEIELKDNYYSGGIDPRPLRHVLNNACEMLAKHGKHQSSGYLRASWSMFSVIRDGVTNLNDHEYKRLLKRADGTYGDFEGVFGVPSSKKKIGDSEAYRWTCYQLTRRVNEESWCEIWNGAWRDNGWLARFRAQHSQITPALEGILASLKAEKMKLAHTVLPLESNPSLCQKYDHVMSVVEMLLEEGGLDTLERYEKWPHREDLSQLVVYAMGIAFLAEDAIDSVSSNNG